MTATATNQKAEALAFAAYLEQLAEDLAETRPLTAEDIATAAQLIKQLAR